MENVQFMEPGQAGHPDLVTQIKDAFMTPQNLITFFVIFGAIALVGYLIKNGGQRRH